MSSAQARSAVASSSSTEGIVVTGMRRAVAAATSMSAGVIVIEAIARRFGLAAMTAALIRSCSRQNRTSQRCTAAISSASVGMCSGSSLSSTSAIARSRASAPGAIDWVM